MLKTKVKIKTNIGTHRNIREGEEKVFFFSFQNHFLRFNIHWLQWKKFDDSNFLFYFVCICYFTHCCCFYSFDIDTVLFSGLFVSHLVLKLNRPSSSINKIRYKSKNVSVKCFFFRLFDAIRVFCLFHNHFDSTMK